MKYARRACFVIAVAILTAGCATAPILPTPVSSLSARANAAGVREFARGNLDRSKKQFERALRLNRSIDNRRGIVDNLNNLAALALRDGNPEAAAASFEEALALSRELGDPAAEADLLINLGAAQEAVGQVQRALASYETAREMAEAHHTTRTLRAALGRMGRLELALERWETAAQHLQTAYALDRTEGDEVGMALRESDLGLLALQQNQPDEALGQLRSALERFRRLENPAGVALALQRLARVHLQQEAFALAEEVGRRALHAHEAIGDTPGAVQDLLILSKIDKGQGKIAAARVWLTQARDHLNGLKSKDLQARIDALDAALSQNTP